MELNFANSDIIAFKSHNCLYKGLTIGFQFYTLKVKIRKGMNT
jgi:hypothetical protein